MLGAYWIVAGKIGEIYNKEVNSFRLKILKILIKLSKVKIITKQDPKLMRPQDVDIQIPSSKNFKKIQVGDKII